VATYNATDAGIRLENTADPAQPDPASLDWDAPPGAPGSAGLHVYLLGCRAWEAWEDDDPAALLARADAVEAAGGGASIEIGRCRCCGGRPLRWSHYCCRCDRAGKDGRARYPGLPVGSAMRPDWVGDDRPKYAPHPSLRGGVA
jgi:hypothetical protein